MADVSTQKKTIEVPNSILKQISELAKNDASYKEVNFSQFTREAIQEKLEREKKKK